LTKPAGQAVGSRGAVIPPAKAVLFVGRASGSYSELPRSPREPTNRKVLPILEPIIVVTGSPVPHDREGSGLFTAWLA
jgi:hypothetical protein